MAVFVGVDFNGEDPFNKLRKERTLNHVGSETAKVHFINICLAQTLTQYTNAIQETALESRLAYQYLELCNAITSYLGVQFLQMKVQ